MENSFQEPASPPNDPRRPSSGGFAYPPPLPPAPPPPPPPPPPQSGGIFLRSCLVAGCATILAPVVLCGGFFLLIYLLVAPGVKSASSTIDTFYSSTQASNLREKVLRTGRNGAGTIAIVNIQGTIDGDGSTLDGTGTLAFVSEQLRVAGEADDIKVVILQIDSPGGGLTPSDQLHHEVLALRKKKTVLAWAGGMMASGGYYIGVGAEGIMASPTATVGSIGVMMQHFQVSELLKTIGVAVDPVTSGAHKDIGSPFRAMTAEERSLLQAYIDSSYQRFVSIVSEGRKMDEDVVKKLADGSIFTAETALEKGLVDKIGYIGDALAWAEELAGEKNMRVITYRPFLSFGDLFREAGRGAAGAALEAAAPEPAPRAMAIWEGK